MQAIKNLLHKHADEGTAQKAEQKMENSPTAHKAEQKLENSPTAQKYADKAEHKADQKAEQHSGGSSSDRYAGTTGTSGSSGRDAGYGSTDYSSRDESSAPRISSGLTANSSHNPNYASNDTTSGTDNYASTSGRTGEGLSSNSGVDFTSGSGAGLSSSRGDDYSSRTTGGDYSSSTGGDYSSRPTGGDYSSGNTGADYSSRTAGGDYSSGNTGADYSSRTTGGDYSSGTTGGLTGTALTDRSVNTSGTSGMGETVGATSTHVTSGAQSGFVEKTLEQLGLDNSGGPHPTFTGNVLDPRANDNIANYHEEIAHGLSGSNSSRQATTGATGMAATSTYADTSAHNTDFSSTGGVPPGYEEERYNHSDHPSHPDYVGSGVGSSATQSYEAPSGPPPSSTLRQTSQSISSDYGDKESRTHTHDSSTRYAEERGVSGGVGQSNYESGHGYVDNVPGTVGMNEMDRFAREREAIAAGHHSGAPKTQAGSGVNTLSTSEGHSSRSHHDPSRDTSRQQGRESASVGAHASPEEIGKALYAHKDVGLSASDQAAAVRAYEAENDETMLPGTQTGEQAGRETNRSGYQTGTQSDYNQSGSQSGYPSGTQSGYQSGTQSGYQSGTQSGYQTGGQSDYDSRNLRHHEDREDRDRQHTSGGVMGLLHQDRRENEHSTGHSHGNNENTGYGREALATGAGLGAVGGSAYAYEQGRESGNVANTYQSTSSTTNTSGQGYYDPTATESTTGPTGFATGYTGASSASHGHDTSRTDKYDQYASQPFATGSSTTHTPAIGTTATTSSAIGSTGGYAEREQSGSTEKRHGLSALLHRDHPNKLHKDPPSSRQYDDQGRVIDPITGLPMNVAKYGSTGGGGTDSSRTVPGVEDKEFVGQGARADWSDIKKENTPY